MIKDEFKESSSFKSEKPQQHNNSNEAKVEVQDT